MSLHREEWERLVMEQIREYTDKLLAVEDFSLACRSVKLLSLFPVISKPCSTIIQVSSCHVHC